MSNPSSLAFVRACHASETDLCRLTVIRYRAADLVAPAARTGAAAPPLNEYVCESNASPLALIGVTLTLVPVTCTLRKWNTWFAEVGFVALPQRLPLPEPGLQPRPYASVEEQFLTPPLAIGSRIPPPPPET